MSYFKGWRRVAGVAGAAMIAAAFAAPAQAEIQYGEVINIHESVLVEESHVAIWAKYGTFCGLTQWVGPVTTCVYDEGSGQLGSIRRINVEGLGELREVMSVQGPTSYTYEVITAGDLMNAKYRSTISTVPGPRAGTAEVHWQTTILRSAFPDDGGVGISNALAGIYRSSLESLKQMAE
jgi:hypothetical protein